MGCGGAISHNERPTRAYESGNCVSSTALNIRADDGKENIYLDLLVNCLGWVPQVLTPEQMDVKTTIKPHGYSGPTCMERVERSLAGLQGGALNLSLHTKK